MVVVPVEPQEVGGLPGQLGRSSARRCPRL